MPYGAWIEQRRNLALTPRCDAFPSTANALKILTNRWYGSGGAGTTTAITGAVDGPNGITSYIRKKWTTASVSNGDSGFGLSSGPAAANGTTGVPLLPNTTYTISIWIRATSASVKNQGGFQAWFHNSSGTYLSTLGTGGIYTATLGQWERRSWTFTTPAATAFGTFIFDYDSGTVWAVNDTLDITGYLFEATDQLKPYFDPVLTNAELERSVWLGLAGASQSTFETREYIPPTPVLPPTVQTVEDVLYGDRTTSYRWEVLEHGNGIDYLIGTLDGVADGSLSWTQNVAVKGSGKLEVADLDEAAPGMLRIGDLELESVRVRPVQIVQGLPENPLGVFLLSSSRENWEATGRVWSIELLDRCTVPAQDLVDQSYAVPAGALILQTVKAILGTCNEYIAVDDSSTLATSNGMVWEAGTSKLKIINDLLDAAGFNALWMDGFGNFRVTPRVLPANRSLKYDLLGIPRELRDGAQGIYTPDWERNRDSFEVPNKVIAVQAAGGADTAAIVGQWTNEDPDSPYSYVRRGRWIPYVLDSVECPAGTPLEILAFLQQRARATLVQMSAVQAQVKITHLPIPVRVSDVLRFSNTRAGVDARHVITQIQLDTSPLGLMKSTLQEVISL